MASSEILDRLHAVIQERERERPAGSYVVSLLEGGHAAMAAKVREEALELCEAAAEEDAEHTAHEAADLIFHMWVLLTAAHVPPERVFAQLEARFGVGGHVEKAARTDGSSC